MAEKLAVEQAILRVPKLRGMTWSVPILLGIFFAILFSAGCHAITKASSAGSVTTTYNFSWIASIGGLAGFCYSFGSGWLGQIFWRSKTLGHIKQQSLALHQKTGVERILLWDAESLTVSSPMLQTQIKWRFIDELVNERVGIHGLSGKQVVFSFPKASLPPDLTADELIKGWQNCFSKPPKLS